MSSLEDLLPEMAGVFAAQESALGSCVAVLSTQLQNLALDTSRQLQRVARLETVAGKTTEALALLQRSSEELQQQHTQQLAELAGLATQTRQMAPSVSVDLDGVKEALATELDARVADTVESLVAAKVATIEAALVQQMNARLLESSNRVVLQAQASEEAMQARLEMLEKKFEYLSKVKMEIKDLGKRMDKQDQTLDDMRTGLSLLVKSVGTDEIDDEEEDGEKRQDDAGDVASPAMVVLPPIVVGGEEQQVEPLPVEAALEMPADDGSPAENEAPVAATPPVTGGRTDRTIEQPQDTPPIENEPPLDDIDPPPRTEAVPSEPEVSPIHEPEETTAAMQQPEQPPAVEPEVHVLPVPEPEVETPLPDQEDEPVEADAITPEPEEPSSSPLSDDHSPPTPERSETFSQPETPQPPSTPEVISFDAAEPTDDEIENTDAMFSMQMSFQVPIVQEPPVHPQIYHMPTTPNLSAVALIRSRREERSAKREQRRDTELALSASAMTIAATPRGPLSREVIRGLWMRIFSKIIQLRRVQVINGTSPDRTLFRKQNMSMGARVKRLEETSADLEETVVMLETSIQSASQALQSVHSAVAQSASTLDKKTKKLDEVQRLHAQTLVGMEEKFDAIEAEFRRLRNVARRDRTQQSVATAAFSQIATQMQDVTTRLGDHATAVATHDKLLQQLVQHDLPGLTTNVQTAVHDLRADVEHKTRELAKALTKAVDDLGSAQVKTEMKLSGRLDASVEALYRDLLVVTSANLVSAELAAKETVALTGPALKKGKHKTPLEIGVSLLNSILSSFDAEQRKTAAGDNNASAEESESQTILSAVVDKLQHFRHELGKLTEQATKAATITSSAGSDGSESAGSKTKPFEDHLIFLCTTLLRTLEEMLVAQSHGQNTGDCAVVIAHIKDLVIQLRAVLFLLVLHTQLVDPPRKLHTMQHAQTAMQATITAHSFSLSQMDTIDAIVKLMNMRLDGFLDMSFSFAKDADVKKSIQEMFDNSDELRQQLTKQMEARHTEGLKRDELIEREVAQLAGRVTKKLDKDEMLWTQEVLERQLQGVAKSALGEEDLIEIQRALRAKLDKSQFHALLQQQHTKLLESGGGGSGATGASNQPLAATKCISCNNELPPSKPQLQSLVREEVQAEVAKALAAAQRHAPPASGAMSPSASSPFNVSGHRSMEKHKKELLLAALQQPKR